VLQVREGELTELNCHPGAIPILFAQLIPHRYIRLGDPVVRRRPNTETPETNPQPDRGSIRRVTEEASTGPAIASYDRPLLGMAGLLEIWAATRRVELVPCAAPRAEEQSWTALPSPAQFDAYAGFTDRRTVQAEPIHVERATGPEAQTDSARETSRLIRNTLTHGAAALDRRTGLLVDFLASVLAGYYCDLILLDTGQGPGELHLLRRQWSSTLRLSIGPGRIEAGFARWAAGIRAGLGMLLPLTNNADADFAATVEAHGLHLDLADLDAADAAVRAWWPKSGAGQEYAEWHEDEDLDQEMHTPQRLDAAAWSAVQTSLESQNVEWATGAAGDNEDADARGELAACLTRDLFDQVTAEVAGAPDPAELLVYGVGLDAVLVGDGDAGTFGCILMVGRQRAGVIAIDLSY
jgi:hypothetical protein